MAAANDNEREKGSNKKKKSKATPKKERQISLRLSAKGAKRLNKLTEATEWSVTQVVEEALKVYAAREGIVLDEKADEKPDDADDLKDVQNREEPPAAELTEEVQAEDAVAEDSKPEEVGPKSAVKKLSGRKPKDRQTADAMTT